MAVGAREHVAVLIPGFLPFARDNSEVGTSCRVATVLRSALEAFYGPSIPVVTLPVARSLNLAARQRTLLRQLQELDGSLRGVRHFHLVGHGPGGVDAELLSLQLPLTNGATWIDLDTTHVRDRIASIVTLGSPHHGTNLFSSPGLGLTSRNPLRYRQAVGLGAALAQRVLHTLRDAGRRTEPTVGALAHLLRVLRYGQDFSAWSPSAMHALRRGNQPEAALSMRVENVVVVAPELTLEQGGVLRKRDRLFAALHAATAQGPTHQGAINLVASSGEVRGSLEEKSPSADAQDTHARAPDSAREPTKFLRPIPARHVIRHASARIPALDSLASDGLVNASHQVLMSRGCQASSVLALAIADHADVIGYHESLSPLPGHKAHGGLFRSGANFGDDEFFQLWGHIAAHIAGIARARSASANFSVEFAAQ